MLKFLLITTLSYCAFASLYPPPPICLNENEEYTNCGGCEPTCAAPNKVNCLAACQKGCFCKDGFVRHNGKCIDPNNCPSKCPGPNEVYNECGFCDKLCRRRMKPCSNTCKPGCYCKPGFVRNIVGICIDENDCKYECGRNEVFSTCGGCDETCDERNIACAAVCNIGCFCKKGLVRNPAGRCIDPRFCITKRGTITYPTAQPSKIKTVTYTPVDPNATGPTKKALTKPTYGPAPTPILFQYYQ